MTFSEQNSDSDKSGNEQDSSLIIHGHQVFQPEQPEASSDISKKTKIFKQKFSR